MQPFYSSASLCWLTKQNQIILKTINWEKLYRENAPALKGLCRRYVGDESLAEDLLHETFITAINKADTFRNHGSIEGWIRKIALNKALLHLRQKQHAMWLDEKLDQTVHETTMEQARNKIRAAIEQASFTAGELLSVIDHLPLHHKTVFNLYVIEGYKHEQIAQMLSISVGTSKSHLSRARKKAQELLYVRALEQQSLIQRRNIAWFLLLLLPGRPVDRIFRRGLKGFEMSTAIPAFVQNATTQNAIKWTATLGGKAVLYGSAATLMAASSWLAFGKRENESVQTSPQPAVFSALPDTVKTNEPDTLSGGVLELLVEEATQEEKKEERKPANAEAVIIRKTIVIHDTIRIEKPAN